MERDGQRDPSLKSTVTTQLGTVTEMLSQQELSDRFEINDLLVRYSHAVDTRNWDLFRQVFTDDALIDYVAFGGPRGSVDEIVTFLDAAMPMFPAYQHMVGLPLVDVDGDRATGRTICHNPMVYGKPDGEQQVFYCGLWYLDVFVRTPDGWRISERVEERSYTFNMPDELQPPS